MISNPSTHVSGGGNQGDVHYRVFLCRCFLWLCAFCQGHWLCHPLVTHMFYHLVLHGQFHCGGHSVGRWSTASPSWSHTHWTGKEEEEKSLVNETSRQEIQRCQMFKWNGSWWKGYGKRELMGAVTAPGSGWSCNCTVIISCLHNIIKQQDRKSNVKTNYDISLRCWWRIRTCSLTPLTTATEKHGNRRRTSCCTPQVGTYTRGAEVVLSLLDFNISSPYMVRSQAGAASRDCALWHQERRLYDSWFYTK